MTTKLEKQPLKYLARQPARIRGHIINAIKKIPHGDIRPLKGLTGAYRLRVGKLRVLYRVAREDEVVVFKIDTRGDVYKT